MRNIMESVGIIAEYNPFHNGHLYHLEQVKKKYPNAVIVLVMSGNFMQRGDVAIFDKWKRTKMALSHGVDLVIELPFPFATQSADFFADGAITLLEECKVSKVIFGSESNQIQDLETIAKTQIENKELDSLVQVYSKLGNNYPTALSLALLDLTGKKIETPNDLLGVSYLKSIYQNQYQIQAETIQRTNDYHNKELEKSISSATAIREALKEKKSIENQVPKDTLLYYEDFHFLEEYFPILKYLILTEKDLSIYQTVDSDIASTFQEHILHVNSLEELITSIKSKRYAYNKIKRMLIHILCRFTKEKANLFQKISYIRILGMNEKGRKYLHSIKKDLSLPLISKISKEKDPMLEYEIETTQIYDLFQNQLQKKEYDSFPIIIK